MNDPVPYRDYLRPRGLTWIKATLRVTVAVQCLGAAAQKLSAGTSSPIATFLMTDLDWPADSASQMDVGAAYGLLVCGILTALRPSWPTLLPAIVWFTAVAVAPLVHGVDALAAFQVMEQSLRFLAPLALLILDFWPPRLKSHLGRTVVSMWMLRAGVFLTYLGMGLLAVLQCVTSGPLLTLVESVAERAGGVVLSDEVTRLWLGALGGVSMALALNVLVTRSKPILVGSMVWGFVTASSRMIELGPVGYPESLVRVAELGAPAVLLLYFSRALREFPPEVIAEN
ncbi:MAG: hypothetical protein KF861_00235 [Planctomycetaceae bacterium]|nr:hypothetical protein [Planctomycetaceae bacterium]